MQRNRGGENEILTLMIAETEVDLSRSWPYWVAVAIVALIVVIVPMMLGRRREDRERREAQERANSPDGELPPNP